MLRFILGPIRSAPLQTFHSPVLEHSMWHYVRCLGWQIPLCQSIKQRSGRDTIVFFSSSVFQEHVFEKGRMRSLGTTVSSTRGVSYHAMGCQRHGRAARRMWEGFARAGFAQLATDALCICGFPMLPWESVGIEPSAQADELEQDTWLLKPSCTAVSFP